MNFEYNILDFVVAGLIVWEIFMGIRRRMAGELFRLLCAALVLAIAWRYYMDFGNQLAAHTRLAASPEMAHAIAFAVLIVMLGMLAALAHLILGLLAHVQFAAGIDRLGGALMGFLRGIVIAILLIYAAGLWPSPDLKSFFTQSSLSGRITMQIAPPTIRFLRAIKIDFQPDPVEKESGDSLVKPQSHKMKRGTAFDSNQETKTNNKLVGAALHAAIRDIREKERNRGM